jgi:uncharacterized protein YuzE
MYLTYSPAQAVASEMLDGEDGSVCVDFDANGDVVGIELIVVDDETVALATSYANAHGLGLTGAHFPSAA